MKTKEIKGTVRTELGKKSTKALRKAGQVPCVIYGGEKNVHFSVSAKEMDKILYTHEVYIIELNIDGKVVKATIKDLQFHPVNDATLHVDFFEVTDDKPVVIEIPVILEGFSVGVQAGGKLQLMQRRLKVKALIKDLPDTLTVDVTNLDLGKVIKVGELDFEGLELVSPANSVVAAVKLTRAARGAAAAAE